MNTGSIKVCPNGKEGYQLSIAEEVLTIFRSIALFTISSRSRFTCQRVTPCVLFTFVLYRHPFCVFAFKVESFSTFPQQALHQAAWRRS